MNPEFRKLTNPKTEQLVKDLTHSVATYINDRAKEVQTPKERDELIMEAMNAVAIAIIPAIVTHPCPREMRMAWDKIFEAHALNFGDFLQGGGSNN